MSTTNPNGGSQVDTELLATLNDLLELDHDAVAAYGIAIHAVQRPDWRDDLVRFRADHERHIQALTRLILAHGGEPAGHPHIPTGLFKSAVQAAGALGSDRELLLAFKSNEGQVRDRYRTAAEQDHPVDVAEVLVTHARDEERHYVWVAAALTRMDAGPDTVTGKAQETYEYLHGGASSLVEGAERTVRSRAGLVGVLTLAGIGAVLGFLGVGMARR
jgi:hypothetical protein